jgi:tRNA threonylcarbamoyladenosine biosynthesis protein TsaB
MLVLAIESATDAAGVALADESGTIVESTLFRGRRHAETIAPSIEFCCVTAGVTLAQVDAVVIDIGPGLFTGLRVGVGTAKALAYALGVPVVALNSLEVLSRAVSAPPGASVVAVLDARRGEVVSAEFPAFGGDLDGPTGEQLETPDLLAARLAGRRDSGALVFAGDGALRYEAILGLVPNCAFAGMSLCAPPVSVLAAMGIELAEKGEFQDPMNIAPRYVRQADVRINWEKRAPRQAAGI